MVGTRSTHCSSGCEQAITDPVLHVVGTVTTMTPERSREPEAKEPLANELNTGAHVTHPRTSVTDWVSEWWVGRGEGAKKGGKASLCAIMGLFGRLPTRISICEHKGAAPRTLAVSAAA